MKLQKAIKKQSEESKTPSPELRENISKEKVGKKKRLKQLLDLGISETAAGRVLRGEFTLKEYNEKQEQIRKWEEEAERLSAVYGIKKGTILHSVLMKERSIEEYIEQGKLREESKERYLKETGHIYFKECIEKRIPLLLACHKTQWKIGLIENLDIYNLKFYDFKKKERKWVEKLKIKYLFKAEKGISIKEFFKIDESIREKNIEPSRVIADRFHLPDDLLKNALDGRHRVRIISNEREIFEGLILWFDRFNVQIELAPDVLILFFLHAVRDFEVIQS